MKTVLIYSVNTLAIVLTVIVALLLIALVIPVTAELFCDRNGFTARLRVLGLRLKIWLEMAKKKKKTEASDEETAGEKKRRFSLQTVRELLAPGAKAAAYILKRLRVYDIEATLIADGKDPAGTAIAAGRTWAVFGVFAATLKNVVKTAEFTHVDVIPDFDGTHAGEEKGSCKIRACAGIIVAAAIVFLKRYGKQKAQRANGKKEAVQ